MNRFLLTAALLVTAIATRAQTYAITKYGAVADGKTLATVAIQKAIDACNGAGGGTVDVPPGTFLTGTISLKSNVELHLESGAVLLGSPNINDYRTYSLPKYPEYGTNHYGILYTEEAENVAITGLGTIDGNGPAYFDVTRAKKIDTLTTRYTRQRNNYRHIASGIGDGLTLEDFTLRWVNPKSIFLTHALETDHVTGLRVERFRGTAAPTNPRLAAISRQNSPDAVVTDPAKAVPPARPGAGSGR